MAVRSRDFISHYQALAQAGEQAAASAGEDETLARLQLDEVNAAISNSEQELSKLNRSVILLWDIDNYNWKYHEGHDVFLFQTKEEP